MRLFRPLAGPRLTIRRIGLLVALCAVALVPAMLRMHTARRQAQAIRALQAAGAVVSFSNQWDSRTRKLIDPASLQPGLLEQLLTRVFGSEYVLQADFVSVVEFQGAASRLSSLRDLPHLSSVAFVNAKIQPSLIDALCQSTCLTTLNLSDTDLSDEDLKRLSSISSLQYINVMGTNVSPQAVHAFHASRPDCKLSVHLDGPFLDSLTRLLETRKVSANRSRSD